MITQTQSPVISVKNLSVAYQQKPVLSDINVNLPESNLIGVIGPNGSGKTTMLKTIMGLMKPLKGQVKLWGKSIKKVRNRISYVPQRGSVDWDFPARAIDVVMMGRTNPKNIFKTYTKQDKAIVWEALEKVQMESFSKRQISELSGGQQQRVFLARALAQEADLYFLDEPFAGVDVATEAAIFNLLKLMKKEGKTIVVVHHDLQTVKTYFDWLILLNNELVATGAVEEVFKAELLQRAYGNRLAIISKENLSEKNIF